MTNLSSRPTRLQGDLIILGQTSELNEPELLQTNLPRTAFPQETLLARYAFSQALSRSTALSALEVAMENYLTSMALLPHTLAKTGKPGMNRKNLIKKLGELMKFRQYLNLNRENFIEAPDFYWTEPELESAFAVSWSCGSWLTLLRVVQVNEQCAGSARKDDCIE